KKAMIGTVVCSVLLGLSFCQDWYGYDTYLPSEARIEEMGIYLGYTYNANNVLNRMHYTDSADIYALLVNATENERYQDYGQKYIQGATVRVTLKNGRSYYRYYILDSDCRESLVNVMESDTYVEAVYGITDSMVEESSYVYLRRGYEAESFREEEADSIRRQLLKALQQDIEEYGILALYSEDTVYCTITFQGYHEEDEAYLYRSLNITDQWINTVQTLKDLGYGSYVEPLNAEDLDALLLSHTIYAEDFENMEDILLSLGERYGVDLTKESLELDSEEYAMLSSELNEKGYISLELTITDREEIEEILALCDYNEGDYDSRLENLFNDGWSIAIDALESQTVNEEYSIILRLRSGSLPKKYLLRMAESVKGD
ncbi:MAG: DUF6449 domain-containing protein, partial [Lachnospiraceae bacterium]|nr:DUF6449 domain-containing protein [Lachnospiraceae bacterium]